MHSQDGRAAFRGRATQTERGWHPAIMLLPGVLLLMLAAAWALDIRSDSALQKYLADQLGESDLQRFEQVLDEEPSAHTVSWVNKSRGALFTLAISGNLRTAAGPCREFDLSVRREQTNTRVHGTACLKHERWRVVE